VEDVLVELVLYVGRMAAWITVTTIGPSRRANTAQAASVALKRQAAAPNPGLLHCCCRSVRRSASRCS
jgi:hypothetical protein